MEIVRKKTKIKGMNYSPNNVFRELNNLMASVYNKYDGTFSNQDCHNIVDD
jgi:hypothetical protein